MADILTGHFGTVKPRRETPVEQKIADAASRIANDTEPHPDTVMLWPTKGNRAETDASFVVSHESYISLADDKIEEMSMYLFSELGYLPNLPWISLWCDKMRVLGLHDLCERLIMGTSAEWKARPSYFGALAIHFHERRERALEVVRMQE